MAVVLVLSWAALIVLAESGDRLIWGGATVALVAFAALAFWRPFWGVCACLLLTGISLSYLYGWRDPTDGLYTVVEGAHLRALGLSINMDSMQASFLLITACMILFAHRQAFPALKRMVLPFGAFLTLAAVSWALSGGKLYGMKTFASLATPLFFAAAVYAAVNPGRDRLAFEKVFYLAVAFSIGAGAVAQLLGGKPLLVLSKGTLRFCGATSPPAFSMACWAALALACSRSLRQDWRGWLLLGALLFLVGATLTRAHMMVAGLVLVAGSLFAPRRKFRSFLLTVFLLLLVLFAFWEPVQRRTFGSGKLSGYLSRFFVESKIGGAPGPRVYASGRRATWAAHWQLARRRPLLGHGPGSAYQLSDAFNVFSLRTPHSEYLRLTVETGLLGAAAYFGAMVYFLVLLFKRRRRDGPVAIWTDAAIISLLAMMLLAVVANVFYVQAFPSAVLAVVAVAMKGSDHKASPQGTEGE